MCHVVLILPLLALPVFWVLPLPAALPVYAMVLGLSALVYWYAIRAMRQPKQNGAECMIGETGQVVVGDLGELHVHVRNELWEAVSPVPLHQGDHVKVVAAADTRLQVQKLDTRATLVTGNSTSARQVRIQAKVPARDHEETSCVSPLSR